MLAACCKDSVTKNETDSARLFVLAVFAESIKKCLFGNLNTTTLTWSGKSNGKPESCDVTEPKVYMST
jgi:hypothetical protein